MEFQPLTIDSYPTIKPYLQLRETYISEQQFANQYIWADYYHTVYYAGDTFLVYRLSSPDAVGLMAPFCRDEDLKDAFLCCRDYFREQKLPFRMYLADEHTIAVLKDAGCLTPDLYYEEDRDSFDYIYDADKLRTLSGKAYHKKKNHLNAFLRDYEGRFEYCRLCCSDVQMIEEFHDRWLLNRSVEDKYNSIRSEEEGIHRLFRSCSKLEVSIGGVFLDGALAAYTIGSYAPQTRCAFIHIEKADTSYHGLYNYINQQFLLHEFPEALLVNREDDLGQEGLRQAKLSYQPLRLEKKFHIFERQ